MLPRRRDISSVTKPSSGALRRWASGSTEFCAVALAKWPHGICPYPAVRPMCPKPPAPPTCPMRLRARGWSPYRLCLDPSRRGCRRDRLAARRLIPRYLAVLKSPPRFSAPVSVSQQSGSRTQIACFSPVRNAASIQAGSWYIREIPDPSRSFTHLDRKDASRLFAATGSY